MTADLFTAETVPAFAPSIATSQDRRNIGRYGQWAEIVVVRGMFGWTDRYAQIDGILYRECGRCSDFTGTLREYGHVFEGVCFLCNGRGYRAQGIVKVETAVTRLDRQVRKEIARLAQVEAARPAMIARELAFRAELVAKAEVAAYAEAERRGAMRYAGQVGEKVQVSGAVRTALVLEPIQYGWSSSMLLVIDSHDGIVVKVVTTASWAWNVERGQDVTITGTVKALEEYRGVLQTVVKSPRLRES